MADLSPAQAALNASDERYELLGPLEDNWQELCLAAAFRAAADRLSEAYVNEEYVDHADDWMLDIAAELGVSVEF